MPPTKTKKTKRIRHAAAVDMNALACSHVMAAIQTLVNADLVAVGAMHFLALGDMDPEADDARRTLIESITEAEKNLVIARLMVLDEFEDSGIHLATDS